MVADAAQEDLIVSKRARSFPDDLLCLDVNILFAFELLL